MVGIETILISIIVLFVVFLAARSLFGLKLCALCAAVALTWLGLLILLFAGREVDSLAVTLLIGGSIVGLMYFLGEKLDEVYNLFKLPFFLSLFTGAYWVLGGAFSWITAGILGVLWVVFVILFSVRNNDRFKSIVKKAVECCKNW